MSIKKNLTSVQPDNRRCVQAQRLGIFCKIVPKCSPNPALHFLLLELTLLRLLLFREFRIVNLNGCLVS